MPTVTPEFPDRRRLRNLVRILLGTAFLLILVRVFILEPYGIPTGSMRPTILEGDVLLVNKLPYTIRSLRTIPFTRIPIPYLELPGFGTLQRGDVVVFDYPVLSDLRPEEGSQYVKRCVAIMGDTVQLVDGRIQVNGVEVPPRWGIEEDGSMRRIPIGRERAVAVLRDGYPVVVPSKGYEIELDSISWGVSNASSMGHGSGGGLGKASFSDLSFVHSVDRASPVIWQACATGTHIKEATITRRKAGKGQQEYMIIKLTDVLITGVTFLGVLYQVNESMADSADGSVPQLLCPLH